MAEYIAIRDCVYGFKFIRKGKKVVGDLADNENFEPVSAADGKKKPLPLHRKLKNRPKRRLIRKKWQSVCVLRS